MTQARVFYFRGGRRKSTGDKRKINSKTQERKLLICSHSHKWDLSTSGRRSRGQFPTSGEQHPAGQTLSVAHLQEICSIQNKLSSFYTKTSSALVFLFSSPRFLTISLRLATLLRPFFLPERGAVDSVNMSHRSVSRCRCT